MNLHSGYFLIAAAIFSPFSSRLRDVTIIVHVDRLKKAGKVSCEDLFR